MTTVIKLFTQEWPVKVTQVDPTGNRCDRVEPYSEAQYYLTSTQSIRFDELPAPDAETVDDATTGDFQPTETAAVEPDEDDKPILSDFAANPPEETV